MKKLIVAGMLLFLFGCSTVPMNVIMTNPNTGKSIYINHYSWGFGLAGASAAIEAQYQQKKSIEAAKQMGFTEMAVVQ